MRQRLTFYLSGEQLDYLRRAAARQRRSLSSYVAACILEFHQQGPADVSAQSTPPFDVLLQESEHRLLAQIARKGHAETAILQRQLISVMAMVDRLVMSVLAHLPEIPADRHGEAAISAERRYRNWKRAVTEMLDTVDAAATTDDDTAPQLPREERV